MDSIGGLVPLYVYLALEGGLLNVYVYLQGGEGGQKWLKSCLRRKSMTPYSKYYVLCVFKQKRIIKSNRS